MPQHKGKRDHRTASGFRAARRSRRIISRLLLKINRWNRYKDEITQGKRKGLESRWDTSRIEKHIALLEKHYG